ncbi:MAG: hypothetical protein VKJ24_09100 [Synechococcales bacterium]|nr:hypothetical protein [Synechococcales bacterium]
MTKLKSDRSYKGRSGNSAARKIEIGGLHGDCDRDPIQMWLIGKPKDVQAMIHNLHMRGVAEPHEWSRPNPWKAIAPELQTQMLNLPEGTVMSVCTKYLS